MKMNVQDLIDRKLVVAKEYPNGFKVLKYARKVFFDALWNTDERLLECRGTVVDKDWNVVIMPFKKIFNYGENGTTVDPELEVVVPTKVNGFMGCVTKINGELVYSTTGSLDSDHVEYIKELVSNEPRDYLNDWTFIFEVCHASDPHIVHEEVGAYLIGMRNLRERIGLPVGHLASECTLNMVAKRFGWKRPKVQQMPFKKALEWCKDTKLEGGVIRDAETGVALCKIKSKHYLSKKCLMRIGKARVSSIFNNPEKFKERVDEEFYSFVDYLVKDVAPETWAAMKDQQRSKVIEDFYNTEANVF